MKRENYQFRFMYFIGIILIVAGHCENGGVSLFYDWFAPYSFHLGLFVFCSGYFFVKNKKENTINIIKKKIKNLIIPLFIWNIIYGLLITFLHNFGINFGENISLQNIFLAPLYSGHQFAFNLCSWFIVPLFLIEIFSIYPIKILKKRNNASYILFIIYLLLGMGGVSLSINGYNTGWWLVLTRFLFFIPFFGLGILYKEKLETKDKTSNTIYFTTIFFIDLILIYINDGLKFYIPSWCNNFDNVYMPFILGFLGIAFWLRVSKIVCPLFKNNKIVNYISRNTFSIMMHQLLGFFILNCIWFTLYKLNVSPSFNVEEFKNNVFYIYLPKNIDEFKILYLIFGVSFSLFISYIIKKLKMILKERYNFFTKSLKISKTRKKAF